MKPRRGPQSDASVQTAHLFPDAPAASWSNPGWPFSSQTLLKAVAHESIVLRSPEQGAMGGGEAGGGWPGGKGGVIGGGGSMQLHIAWQYLPMFCVTHAQAPGVVVWHSLTPTRAVIEPAQVV